MSDGYFIPVKRESPDKRQHLHTMEGGAWLPFAQSLLSALIVFIGISAMFTALRWRDPIKWGVVFSSMVFILSWLYLARHWLSLTSLEKLETMTGIDINRDGFIGTPPPPAPREVVKLQMTSADRSHIWDFDLPITPEQLRTLAKGLLNNLPFSERPWTGSGKLFSIQEYIDLRSAMLKNELLEQVNPKDARQGFRLTEAGRQLMELYASPTPPLSR